eukprot:jgi/Bigna1/88964/estExt_fgenesh1_pg.C_410079
MVFLLRLAGLRQEIFDEPKTRCLSTSPPSSEPMSRSTFRWDDKVSNRAKIRPDNQLKKLCSPFLGKDDMVLLGGGLPNAQAFPFVSFEAKITGGEEVKVTEGNGLRLALQYNGAGVKSLTAWCRDFMEEYVKPASKGWDVVPTAGSSDAIEKLCGLLLNPGDVVLTEDHTYSAALSNIRGVGAKACGVAADELGIIPEKLEEKCQALAEKKASFVGIYLIPVGANPSGAVMSEERIKQIYDIAPKYDLWIM